MNSKAKVGLIVDNCDQTRQIMELINYSHDSSVYEISHLIVQDIPKKRLFELMGKTSIADKISAGSFKIITKIEEYFVKSNPQYKKLLPFFKKYSIKDLKLPVIKVSPEISESGYVFRYSKNDLQRIKAEGIELLVRCGSGILRGEVLNICEKGIISFHHADNRVNRGSPPGFWEVLERQKSTGFIIQILNDELDGGDVLFRGNIATSYLYTLNKIKLYRRANIFMHKTLENLFEDTGQKRFYRKEPYSHMLYRLPSLAKQSEYIFKTGFHILKKVIRKIFGKRLRWSVAYQFIDEWRGVALWKSKVIENPPNRFLADPFILFHEDKHYCFLEDYNYSSQKGRISVYEINYSGEKDLGVALEEDFHLSYPYLIKDNNNLYMCPETHDTRDIRIYKCIDFPNKWELEKILITDVTAADTSIFKIDSKWWMLTNIDTSNIGDHDSELHIFSAEELLSDKWTPHPLNPVLFDSRRARNGGFIADKGKIYRVFQKQGWDLYGEAFGVAEITEINGDDYQEEVIFEVSPKFHNKAIGTHTLNYHRGLLATDFLVFSDIKK